MKHMSRPFFKLICLLVLPLGWYGPVFAQQEEESECVDLEGTPPGLYVTVDQNQVFLIKDGKVVELDPGESGYANETSVACLKVPPRVLAWPCNTTEALARSMAPGYSAAELPDFGGPAEVRDRYFGENQAISPEIEWLNGEIHGRYDPREFQGFDTEAYAYLSAGEDLFASPKRPHTLLVNLFWSTGQAVIDARVLAALQAESTDGLVPVAFVFNRDNEVPVSFFGPQVTLQEVIEAYLEKGVELAPVPVWYAGDHHMEVSLQELENLADIPDLDDISEETQQRLRADLEAHGFKYKPVSVSILSGSDSLLVDQPDRVRIAADMGMTQFPVVMFYFNDSSHLAGCGVTLPQVSAVGIGPAGGAGGGPVDAGGTPGGGPGVPLPPSLPKPEKPVSGS